MTENFPIILSFINGFTLALALAFLLIVLWYDIQREVNQYFAVLLIFVLLWNVGFFIEQIAEIVDAPDTLSALGDAISGAGFVGASVSLYALMLVVAGVQPRRFRLLISFYLLIGAGYFLSTAFTPQTANTILQARLFSGIFFIGFDLLTLYVTWRYRRKYNSLTLITGNMLFILGQGITFLNPELGIVALAATFSASGALAISFAIVRRELIRPLTERSNQLETMHGVSLAIASQFATDSVLKGIAERAAEWLEADAAGIFLKRGQMLQLVAIHNLPGPILDLEIKPGRGVAGRVAESKQSVYLENYPRDWHYEDEFDFARETFGSLISVPLIYGNSVIGVLSVISGAHGTLFEKDDVHLLELLAAQAAVAISQVNLFEEQRTLATRLTSLNDRLNIVLKSTENPVLAVDRQLNLIFTNPAAESLFRLDTIHSRANLNKAVPRHALPINYKEALKSIKRRGFYRYEINTNNATYLCQVAGLGDQKRPEGFVAVMNDVSELKELDRIKSEMVRMTSHDLKNPLQAAFANLELLRDDVEIIGDDEITLSVDNIERQLNKMHRIISGILDLERVRVGSTLDEICSPGEIINDAIEELSDIARDAGIVLRADVDAKIAKFQGDSDQFKRAIVNIVENAIKFNSSGGEVLIQANNRGNQIFITISDDGIGIPDDLQPKIFDRFYRGHQSGAEHISGSGLGLSLVKAVIESHNGQIWLRSQLHIGTTFHITIPAITQQGNVSS